GWRGADTFTASLPASFGVAGRGPCHIQKARGGSFMFCMGMGRVKEIPFEDFEVDPLLAEADLRMKQGRHVQRVHWAGSSSTPSFGGNIDGGDAVSVQYGFDRSARPSGSLFGRKVAPGRNAFGYLTAGGFAFVGAEERSIEFLPGGRVRFEVKIPVGR
ncbi:MAG TPA: hypothetical protein VFS18_03435, partial [Actinomycetota bacterium]|nr:hypothetical protein [Actinomycetota bacterium]